MPEIFFYKLKNSSSEIFLTSLIEKSIENNWNSVVLLDNIERMEEINDLTDDDFKSTEKKKSNLIGDNSWNVQTWDNFCLYVCPECHFMDQDHNAFCDHALKTHEKVKIYSRFC